MPLKSSEVSSQLNVHEESWISSMRLFYMFDSFDDPLPSLPSSRQKLRLLFPACIVVGTGYWAAQKGLFLPQFHQGAAPRRPAAGSSPKATEFNPWTAPPRCDGKHLASCVTFRLGRPASRRLAPPPQGSPNTAPQCWQTAVMDSWRNVRLSRTDARSCSFPFRHKRARHQRLHYLFVYLFPFNLKKCNTSKCYTEFY